MNILCAICQELVSYDDGQMFATRCGHIFHYSCLLDWLERKESCPHCSKRVTEQCIFRLYPSLSNEDPAMEQLQLCMEEATANLERQKKLCKEKDDTITMLTVELTTANYNQVERTEESKRKLNKLMEENETLKRNIQSSNCLTEIAAAALKEKRKHMEAQDEEMRALRRENDEIKQKLDSSTSELKKLTDGKEKLTHTIRNQEVNRVKEQFEALNNKLSSLKDHLTNQDSTIAELNTKIGTEELDHKTVAFTTWLMEKYEALQITVQTLKESKTCPRCRETVTAPNEKTTTEEVGPRLTESLLDLSQSVQTLFKVQNDSLQWLSSTMNKFGQAVVQPSAEPGGLDEAVENKQESPESSHQNIREETTSKQTDKETTRQNTAVLGGTDNTSVLGGTDNTSVQGGTDNTSVLGGTSNTLVLEGTRENTAPPDVKSIAAEIENRLHFAQTESVKSKQESTESSDQNKREETSKQTDKKSTLQNSGKFTELKDDDGVATEIKNRLLFAQQRKMDSQD